MIAINRRRVMGKNGVPLPYDAEVEYLESTGTQYIDTFLSPNSSSEFVIDADFVTYQKDDVFFSASTNWNFSQLTLFYSVQRFYFAVKSVFFTQTFERHTYKVVGSTLFVDDVQKVTTPWDNSFVNTTLKIFTHGSISRFTGGKLYGFKFFDNNNTICDAIPVRVGTTGYMYDKVSGVLFGNEGTGDFIVGPDK